MPFITPLRKMHEFLTDLIVLKATDNDLPLSGVFPSDFVVSSHTGLTHIIYFGQKKNSRLEVNEDLNNVLTTMRCHYTPTRIFKIQNTDNSRCW